MKRIISGTFLLSLLACSTASAIEFNIIPNGPSPNGVYSLYLDGMSETFDSIDLTVVPGPSSTLLNPVGGLNVFVPRPPGEESTFVSGILSFPTPAGLGWTTLVNESTSDELRVAGGPLMATIDTPPAPGLFLANIMVPVGGSFTATLQVVNDGNTIASFNTFCCIPEPTATLSLTVLCLVGVAGGRYR